MTKEELAKWLHDNYEAIAKDKKWNTQENCKVEFDTLPEQNKQTMLEIADRLLNFNLLSQHFVSGRSELLLALCDCGYMADKNNICTGCGLEKPRDVVL